MSEDCHPSVSEMDEMIVNGVDYGIAHKPLFAFIRNGKIEYSTDDIAMARAYHELTKDSL